MPQRASSVEFIQCFFRWRWSGTENWLSFKNVICNSSILPLVKDRWILCGWNRSVAIFFIYESYFLTPPPSLFLLQQCYIEASAKVRAKLNKVVSVRQFVICKRQFQFLEWVSRNWNWRSTLRLDEELRYIEPCVRCRYIMFVILYYAPCHSYL